MEPSASSIRGNWRRNRLCFWISVSKKGSPRSMISIMTTGIMTAFCFSIPFRGRGFLRRRRAAAGLSAGTAFFSCIPEKSRYYLPAGEPENRWEYLYVHFQGPAAVPFFRKIRDSFGPVVTVPADSFPIQLWLNLHEDMTNGRQLRRYEGGDLVYRFLSSLLRTLEEPQRPALTPCVEESIRYMKEHFPEHFSIEELAAYKGLPPPISPGFLPGETGAVPGQISDRAAAFPCAVPASEHHHARGSSGPGLRFLLRELFL